MYYQPICPLSNAGEEFCPHVFGDRWSTILIMKFLIKSRNSRVPDEHGLDLQCHIQYLLFSSPHCFLWSPVVKHHADIHGRKTGTNFECSWEIHWKHILLFWSYITWIDKHVIYTIQRDIFWSLKDSSESVILCLCQQKIPQ